MGQSVGQSQEGVDPGLHDEVDHQRQQQEERGVRGVLLRRGLQQVAGELIERVTALCTPPGHRFVQVTRGHQVPAALRQCVEGWISLVRARC